MENTAAPAGIGHNNPPPNTPEALRQYLTEVNDDLLSRQAECLERATQTPEECNDDELESTITERIGQIQKCFKDMEAKRVAEKAPYLSLERAVDGFFSPMLQRLEAAKQRLSRIGGAYQARKAQAAREAAALAAEEARKVREAAEAAAAESERVARETREAAERARIANQPTVAKELEKQANVAQKESQQHLTAAVKSEKVENKATAMSQAKPSKLAASHGTYGSRGSLRISWKGRVADRKQLDYTPLLAHLSDEALQVALNRYIDANSKGDAAPQLQGCTFWRDEKMQVRA